MGTGRISSRARRATVWTVALSTVLVPSAIRALDDASAIRVIGEARLHDPTAPGAEMLGWALERYREAHLAVPAVDVHFHPDPSGCRGNLGYFEGLRVDLCVRLEMEPGPQRIVLHELAHAWTRAHLTDDARAAFTLVRGLATWSDESADWKDRGIEQAAEIMAWGLGDGTMMPMISGDRDPAALADAFQVLTGADPLHVAA